MAYFESLGLIMKWDLNGFLKSVKSQDFSTIRLGIPNKDFEITFAKLSSNWQQETKDRRYKAVPIDLYNDIETKAKISNFVEQSLFEDFSKWNGTLKYIRRYKPGQVYYSQPKYASALKWIYADGQIQNFHANNVDNSFAPAFIVYVPYKLTGVDENGKDMKDSLRDYISDRLTGADNGGKFAILDGSSKEGSIQIIPFSQSTSHEMYITLSNLIRDHIATAFQVPSILAGIQVSGKLGTAKEIADSSIYYQNAVIKHDQNLLMYEMNALAKLMDGYDGTIIKVTNSIPLAFVADSFATAFTEEEIREAFGYSPKKVESITPINLNI
jgi:capsid portal protein